MQVIQLSNHTLSWLSSQVETKLSQLQSTKKGQVPTNTQTQRNKDDSLSVDTRQLAIPVYQLIA